MERINFTYADNASGMAYINEISLALFNSDDRLSKAVGEFFAQRQIDEYAEYMDWMGTTQPSFSIDSKHDIPIGRLNHNGKDFYPYMANLLENVLSCSNELELRTWGGSQVIDIMDVLEFLYDATGDCESDEIEKQILKNASEHIKVLLEVMKQIADNRIEYFRTTYKVSYADFRIFVETTGRKFYLDNGKILEKTFIEF